jgi:hypothetical protein
MITNFVWFGAFFCGDGSVFLLIIGGIVVLGDGGPVSGSSVVGGVSVGDIIVG